MSLREAALRTLDFVRRRKQNYQRTFMNPIGQEVLRDLADWCRANETCVIPGDRDRTLILEGRREVWLRIQQHLNLSANHLFELYTNKPITLTESGND